MKLLDSIPFNGYKTYLGLILIALTLGLGEMGYIDATTVEQLVQWLTVATGVAFAHKVDKSRQ